MSNFHPRRGQREIMGYQGGRMGVAAVPGSGKTATIAALAARLIARRMAKGGQILIVTYQNAAVNNLRARIRENLEAMDLLQVGYDVRTLHSLSYGIVQANPGLAGTTADFEVLDERASTRLLEKAVHLWNNQNTRTWARLAPDDYYDERWEQEWRRIAQKIARTVISAAKNRRIKPEILLEMVGAGGAEVDQFLCIGAQLYQLYQVQVENIGGLDFDDLVSMAVDLLEYHPDLRERLRRRWPIVLEDEAQDSVPLQEELLGLLTGEQGNWIRVGDPNQSIMSTFTAADPGYLRRFLERPEVETVEMAISGRCAPRIMDMANHLVDWTCDRHPLAAVRQQTFRRQHISATGPDDGQQNPGDETSSIVFREYNNRLEEQKDIVRRARQFAEKNPENTVAILVPTNRIGYDLAEYMRECRIPFDEMLQSTRPERQVAETMSRVITYLADPLQRNNLEAAYMGLRELLPASEENGDAENVSLLLRSCYRPETLLFPTQETRIEDALPPVGEVPPGDLQDIVVLTRYLRRWLRASALPVDQLVMTVAQDVLMDADLARSQKLAAHLRSRGEQNLDWRLPDLAGELEQVVRGKTTVLMPEDGSIEPRPGRIALTTMHKAKGLEWDLVYLMGVDSDWFPHTLENHFRGEYEFLGGDPAAEARAALLNLSGETAADSVSATDAAHMDIIAERLRLLYVGITRARRYLALSRSREIPMGMRMRPAGLAAAFYQLRSYYKANYASE
jgi:DNA helicase-2/ATP-dependent DNA helicase PcrA